MKKFFTLRKKLKFKSSQVSNKAETSKKFKNTKVPAKFEAQNFITSKVKVRTQKMFIKSIKIRYRSTNRLSKTSNCAQKSIPINSKLDKLKPIMIRRHPP